MDKRICIEYSDNDSSILLEQNGTCDIDLYELAYMFQQFMYAMSFTDKQIKEVFKKETRM